MATITVRVDKFIGYGSHVHVTMRTDGDTATERVMKFRRREAALRWVDHVYRTEFDPDRDQIVWSDTPTHRWFYGEGD